MATTDVAPIPDNESERLAELHNLSNSRHRAGSSLRPPCSHGSHTSAAPIALISWLIDRQLFVRRHGLQAEGSPRDMAFALMRSSRWTFWSFMTPARDPRFRKTWLKGIWGFASTPEHHLSPRMAIVLASFASFLYYWNARLFPKRPRKSFRNWAAIAIDEMELRLSIRRVAGFGSRFRIFSKPLNRASAQRRKSLNSSRP